MGDDDDPGAEKGEARGEEKLSGMFKPRRPAAEEIQKSSRPWRGHQHTKPACMDMFLYIQFCLHQPLRPAAKPELQCPGVLRELEPHSRKHIQPSLRELVPHQIKHVFPLTVFIFYQLKLRNVHLTFV